MSGSTLLETRDLALEYGSHAVVADPNTVVRPGEIVGLLGANGVGETTTLARTRSGNSSRYPGR
jgi:ABC-type branched-subunit amino acid transport system ATPase component